MSLDTWKAEFYPTDASDCSPELSLNHSLRKWEGLTKKNLKKHNCVYEWGFGGVHELDSTSPIVVRINSHTCALCMNFEDSGENDCEKCPLAIARGDALNPYIACDDSRITEFDSRPPWQEFNNTGSPTKMLYWLRRAVKEQN